MTPADRRATVVEALIAHDPDLVRRYHTQAQFRHGLDAAIDLLDCTVAGLAQAADVADHHLAVVEQFAGQTVPGFDTSGWVREAGRCAVPHPDDPARPCLRLEGHATEVHSDLYGSWSSVAEVDR